jgi:hypothetical protein
MAPNDLLAAWSSTTFRRFGTICGRRPINRMRSCFTMQVKMLNAALRETPNDLNTAGYTISTQRFGYWNPLSNKRQPKRSLAKSSAGTAQKLEIVEKMA